MTGMKVTPCSTMFEIAESWQQSNKPRQAIVMYFKLVEHFPDTLEAVESEKRLLGLAQEFRGKGKVYEALGISERLARVVP